MTINEKGIFINHITYPVSVLGPGIRLGIWFQGCSIRCKGCMSEHTWDFDERYFLSYEDIEKKLEDYSRFIPEGVTISGGEPFDQIFGLEKLIKLLRKKDFKEILVYSGYSFDYLNLHYCKILSQIDLLICEPYQINTPNLKKWCGSDNQKIVTLSCSAKKRFDEEALNSINDSQDPHLQIDFYETKIMIIGIPRKDDLVKIKGIVL